MVVSLIDASILTGSVPKANPAHHAVAPAATMGTTYHYAVVARNIVWVSEAVEAP